MFNLGDKYYYVSESLNSFRRRKITKIDESGVEWHRYDMPTRTYDIHEYVVMGKVTPIIEGELTECDWSLSEVMIHAQCPGRDAEVVTEEDLKTWIESSAYYFSDRKTAEDKIALANSLDVGIEKL